MDSELENPSCFEAREDRWMDESKMGGYNWNSIPQVETFLAGRLRCDHIGRTECDLFARTEEDHITRTETRSDFPN